MAKIKRKFTDALQGCFSNKELKLGEWVYSDDMIIKDCRRYMAFDHSDQHGWSLSPCTRCMVDVSTLLRFYMVLNLL